MQPSRPSRRPRSSANDSSLLNLVIMAATPLAPGLVPRTLPRPTGSDGRAPVEGFGADAVDGDVGEALPRADLRPVERGRERRVALRDELHRPLDLFRFGEAFGAARHHHAAPAARVRHLIDLKAA